VVKGSAAILAVAFLVASACRDTRAAEGKTYRGDNSVVKYSGISDSYAKALGRVAEVARGAAIEQFGFDMPETISIEVAIGAKTRLFTDGAGFMSLTVRSQADLRKPSASGVFNIYGVCHEIGHMAMYRMIPERLWMTSDAGEGWACYLGARLVDIVRDREGVDLWPDRYDYRVDGTARLKGQIAKTDPISKAAAVWMELVNIVGDKGIAPILAAWGKASVDLEDPGAALRQALLATNSEPRLAGWWRKAEGAFVERRPKSAVAEQTTQVENLSDKTAELSRDDGASAGIRSMSGSGHAVRFDAPSGDWYLTAVKIYGSRYGTEQPPAENFHVWLCDGNFRTIADFPFPYSSFERGNAGWVTLSTRPTKVPRRFVICAGFNPTKTKGIYVHYDKAASGNSYLSLPGTSPSPFKTGDWLIRAEVRLAAVSPARGASTP